MKKSGPPTLCDCRSGEPPVPISLDKLDIGVTYVYDTWGGKKNAGKGGCSRNLKSRNPNILYEDKRNSFFFLLFFFSFFPLISYFVTAFLEYVGGDERRGEGVRVGSRTKMIFRYRKNVLSMRFLQLKQNKKKKPCPKSRHTGSTPSLEITPSWLWLNTCCCNRRWAWKGSSCEMRISHRRGRQSRSITLYPAAVSFWLPFDAVDKREKEN